MHDEDRSLVNIAENPTSLLIVHIHNSTPQLPKTLPLHIGTFVWILTHIYEYSQVSTNIVWVTPPLGGPLEANF